MVFSQAKGINWVAVSIIWLTVEHWRTFSLSQGPHACSIGSGACGTDGKIKT
jgi:hypothetical protein